MVHGDVVVGEMVRDCVEYSETERAIFGEFVVLPPSRRLGMCFHCCLFVS